MIRHQDVISKIALVGSLCVSAHSAHAGFAEGMVAYARGDMKAAIREFTPAAHAGDSRAQFLLAQIYEQTKLAPRGKADAVIWYRRAAINGVVAAMRRLGDIYGGGDGADILKRPGVETGLQPVRFGYRFPLLRRDGSPHKQAEPKNDNES